MTTRRGFLKTLAAIPVIVAAPSIVLPDKVVHRGFQMVWAPDLDKPRSLLFTNLALGQFGNRIPQCRLVLTSPHGPGLEYNSAIIWSCGILENYRGMGDYDYTSSIRYLLPKNTVSVDRVFLDEMEVFAGADSGYTMTIESEDENETWM